MAFDKFAIVPKTGSIMLTESIGNYNPSMLSDDDKKKIEKSPIFDHDPVDKLRVKLESLYKIRQELLSMDYTYNDLDKQLAIVSTDTISKDATIIVETIQKCLAKFYCMTNIFSSDYGFDIKYQSFKNYAGIILKNLPKLKSEGYTSNSFTTFEFDEIMNAYDIARIFKKYPSIISNDYIDFSYINNIGYNFTKFTCMSDFMSCFFEDVDKWNRLETSYQYNITIDNILSSVRYNGETPVQYGFNSGYDNDIVILATSLSNVKQSIYNLQCNIMDNEVDQLYYQKTLRSNILTLVNIFDIYLIVLLHRAYTLRNSIEEKQSCDTLVNKIISNI